MLFMTKSYKFYNYIGLLKHIHYKVGTRGKFFIGRIYLNNKTSKFIKGNENQITMLEKLDLTKPLAIWGNYVQGGAFSIKRISEPLKGCLEYYESQNKENIITFF